MVLWSFLAVLTSCASSSIPSRKWFTWLLAYLCMVALSVVWAVRAELLEAEDEDADAGEGEEGRGWWDEVLLGINHLVPTTLYLLPLALSARDLVRQEARDTELITKMSQQQGFEAKLLEALVPTPVSDRLARGDALIADAYVDATVLFIYVCDYDQTLLNHNAEPTIKWMNRMLTALDDSIAMAPSHITKVETFNNFLLVFAGRRSPPELDTAKFLSDEQVAPEEEEGAERHAEDCLGLAVAMLQAVAAIKRPDGKPTTVKVGLNSGPLTAGVIGSGSPRYSIFGDTVNTASRMASSSTPCTAAMPFIHMSQATQTRLEASFQSDLLATMGLKVAPRAEALEIKGKGLMQTYCLSKPDSTVSAGDTPQRVPGTSSA